MKTKLILAAFFGVILVAGVFGYIKISNNTQKAENLREIQACKDFFEEDIVEIRLRESVDSSVWAVFSDSELIDKWKNYFENTTFNYAGEVDETSTNGGKKVIDVKANDNTLTFCFIDTENELKIIINEKIYTAKGDVEFPFEETYTAAIERNGKKTPWD